MKNDTEENEVKILPNGTLEVILGVPDRDKASTTYSRSALPGAQYSFGFKNRNYKKSVVMSRDFFIRDSLARRIFETMIQFSATPVSFMGEQKNVEFYKDWISLSGINDFQKKFFKDYYLSSVVHSVRSSLPFKGTIGQRLFKNPSGFGSTKILGEAILTSNVREDIDARIRATAAYVGEGYTKDEAAKKLRWTKKMLPSGYTTLDPLQIQKKGTPYFGMEVVEWVPPTELKTIFHKLESLGSNLLNRAFPLPEILYSQLKSNQNEVELTSDFYSVVYRMKQDYDCDPEVLLQPILPHLVRKDNMRKADERVIESVISKILLIKVGNDKFPARTEDINMIASIMKSKGDLLELVWNHAIDIQWIDVKTDFLNDSKYDSVNADILEGFGITKIILGNTKDMAGNSWMSLRGLIENMKDGQDAFSNWLKGEMELVAEIMGFDSCPTPYLKTINLDDKVSLYKIYQGMVDRGILSAESVCSEIGEDWSAIQQQIQKEYSLRKRGMLPMLGSPYHKAAETSGSSKKGETEEEEEVDDDEEGGKTKTNKKELNGMSGRPVGSGTPIGDRKQQRKQAASAWMDLMAQDVAEMLNVTFD